MLSNEPVFILKNLKNMFKLVSKSLDVYKRQVWDGEMWKIRKNRELRGLYGEADIDEAMKAQNLRWLRHGL